MSSLVLDGCDHAKRRVTPLAVVEDLEVFEDGVLYPETFTALGWEPVRSVLEINLAWGKGSGKDFTSRIILSRVLYLLLSLESPQGYFGMAETETICGHEYRNRGPASEAHLFRPVGADAGSQPVLHGADRPAGTQHRGREKSAGHIGPQFGRVSGGAAGVAVLLCLDTRDWTAESAVTGGNKVPTVVSGR